MDITKAQYWSLRGTHDRLIREKESCEELLSHSCEAKDHHLLRKVLDRIRVCEAEYQAFMNTLEILGLEKHATGELSPLEQLAIEGDDE